MTPRYWRIYQALHFIDRRQGNGLRYTLHQLHRRHRASADDVLGPGQAHAIAAMGACDRILERDNQVTMRWVPAHNKVEGSESADSYAKAAVGRTAPCCNTNTPEDFLDEVSLPYMKRTATEARSQVTAE